MMARMSDGQASSGRKPQKPSELLKSTSRNDRWLTKVGAGADVVIERRRIHGSSTREDITRHALNRKIIRSAASPQL
jgi:hypothetical protein